MSPNYLAPAFTVEINGTGLEADISKYIQQISVISERDSMDNFSFSVANPYPQMRWTHEEKDAKLFSIGNAVTISMGYVGEEQQMIAGEITKVSASFPSSGTPTLNVEGHTWLHRLTRRQRTRTFRKLNDKQIVEQIAADHGLTPQVEETTETTTAHASVTQSNKTDFDFLKDRAQRIHFEIRVEDKTLIFCPAHATTGPIVTLEWGKTLQSFTPSMNARGQVNQVTVRGYDPQAKKAIIGRFTGTGSGGQSGPEVAEQAFGRGEEVHVDYPVASQAEADQRAQAIYNERIRRFITGSGTTIGLPMLRAGQTIELKKLGPFKGTYRLNQVTHTIGSGGYTTSFNGEWFQ